jgi:16S rRNA (cytosine1402-N4)-methyltransferase
MLGLEVRPGGIWVDGTLGGGSHTRALLERSAPDGIVYSFDVDPKALERAKESLKSFGDRFQSVEANFRNLDDRLAERGVMSVDGILLDLGVSSDEIADPSKGLSFMTEGPLDMRLGPKANEDGLTAADIVNTWKPNEIEQLIREFGEEKFAKRIVDAIVMARKSSRITRTTELAGIIKQAVPAGYERGRIHPATRTFQALRIAVNDEIEALKEAIDGSHRILAAGGSLAIISFHSLEDRIVKTAFKDKERWEPLTKRPQEATEAEISKNPRSRSAKVRVAKKK